MDVRRFWFPVLLAASLAGCVSSSSSHRCEQDDNSVDLGPLIGLFGMAVDGDDKDDYEDLVHGKSCRCRKCCH